MGSWVEEEAEEVIGEWVGGRVRYLPLCFRAGMGGWVGGWVGVWTDLGVSYLLENDVIATNHHLHYCWGLVFPQADAEGGEDGGDEGLWFGWVGGWVGE